MLLNQLLLLNAVKEVASRLADVMSAACTAVQKKSDNEAWDAFKTCAMVSV